MPTMLKSAPAPLSSPFDSLPADPRTRRLGLVRRLALAAADLLVLWEQRLNDRDTLRAMDDARLRDAGLSQGQVYRETAKPFWRA